MTPEPLTIALAAPADHGPAGDLTVAAYQPSGMAPDDPYYGVLRDVAARVDAGASVFVARLGDEVVGTATWCPPGCPLQEVAGPGEGEIRAVAVAPGHQGLGIGRALVRTCIEASRDARHGALVLSSAGWMRTAHRLYESLGFERLPERDWAPRPEVPLRVYGLPLTPHAPVAVVLRRYTDADAAATLEAFDAAISTTAARHYSAEQVTAWRGAPRGLEAWNRRRSTAWTLVAEVGGRVVGFSDLTEDGELDMLFVHPDAGGRGVARRLVDAVLAEAGRRGLDRVTTRASRAARPAFERFGFVVDADDDHNTVGGVVVPNHRMHADLGRLGVREP